MWLSKTPVREIQVTKLSIQLVQDHLLRESEEVKATYDTMKAPDGKSKTVGSPKDLSGRKDKVSQIDVPTQHKSPTKKASAGKGAPGIPQAKRADEMDLVPVPKTSTAKNQKSPATPATKKTSPNQTTKMKEITGAIKGTEAGKATKGGIPAADFADTYTKGMARGSATLGTKDGKTPEVKAPTAASLNGTTSPARKAASMKTPVDQKKVTQVTGPTGSMKTPSDAGKVPSWDKNIQGHNVMESVQIVVNGRAKATFGVINRDVAAKLVESYKQYGYAVSVQRGPDAAWKKDRTLLRTIFESVHASHNNAPETSRRLAKAAMNRFFQVTQGDYNTMYESRQQFSRTLQTAFNRIMEQADLKYRQSLDVVEGMVRVEVNGEVIDLDMITQARDTDMALRNFRNEAIEEYGFGAKIKHIFIEGQKYLAKDITEWQSALTS
jgi:hypothetical protein